MRLGLALPGAWALALAGCKSPVASGPVEIMWDRDTCKRCGMVISDRRFAAQMRGGPEQQAFKFDDIGCALFWLADQAWKGDPKTELWVADARTLAWLDARRAQFVEGKVSPMGYNFGAYAQPDAAAVAFEAMRSTLLARGK